MAETPKLTGSEAEIMRHALGLDRAKAAYRNRYITGPGTDTYPGCEALVARGLMGRRDGHPELTGGDPVYFVTKQGIEALQANGEEESDG